MKYLLVFIYIMIFANYCFAENGLIAWYTFDNDSSTVVYDSSGNNITGILNGGDLKIHYFGVLPTPTKFILPTLPEIRRITFSPPQPTNTTGPQPTIGFDFGFNRSIRPQIPR